MKDKSSKAISDQIIDEIIDELPLKDRVLVANMNKEAVEVLESVFDLYIRSKIDPEDEEYTNIMEKLWERLRETHGLRVVK